MSFENLQLQIPAHQHCGHFVKARVRVHRYRMVRQQSTAGELADYDAQGYLFAQQLQAVV